ncbi:hypothetical protein M413DRAFT_447464 [Hebeloma cylindrosporum]|uniref:Secreted protein n=1 Tax=Hebeloma cylindrosporum TaxID=76867 RepID=A0A0C3C6C7_HEBCY|nr:hypothetical protein M413DRAFT_447464 [Hebeloma cylindrosporum h7]
MWATLHILVLISPFASSHPLSIPLSSKTPPLLCPQGKQPRQYGTSSAILVMKELRSPWFLFILFFCCLHTPKSPHSGRMFQGRHTGRKASYLNWCYLQPGINWVVHKAAIFISFLLFKCDDFPLEKSLICIDYLHLV